MNTYKTEIVKKMDQYQIRFYNIDSEDSNEYRLYYFENYPTLEQAEENIKKYNKNLGIED
jgi:hypothetical protein